MTTVYRTVERAEAQEQAIQQITTQRGERLGRTCSCLRVEWFFWATSHLLRIRESLTVGDRAETLRRVEAAFDRFIPMEKGENHDLLDVWTPRDAR